MIDILGIFIGAAIELLLGAVIGVMYALIAWLILPKRIGNSIRIAIAFSIPVVSAAYIWLAAALLPGQSLFGDIDQPLPNGYRLKALGKMPEYGSIESDTPLSKPGVAGVVDQIAVSGPFVAARYCQTCNAAFVNSRSPFVLLDTRNGRSSEYTSLSALYITFPSTSPLIENQFFRSQEAGAVRQQRIEHAIIFTPPIICSALYFAYAIRRRVRANPSPSTRVYT